VVRWRQELAADLTLPRLRRRWEPSRSTAGDAPFTPEERSAILGHATRAAGEAARQINSAWLAASLTVATLLSWLRLMALDSAFASAAPKALRYRILQPQASSPTSAAAENPRDLALGGRHQYRLDRDDRPVATP
jgi:hypothetical protein